MADLGVVLGKGAIETNRMNSELSVAEAGDITILDLSINNLEVWNCRIQEKKQSIAGDTLIWSNPVFGIWGTGKWGSTVADAFVLGSTGAGILGLSILGSRLSDYEIQHVTNAHNFFPEGFWNDRFIGSESTGSPYIADENGYYLLEGGQYLLTEYIAKEDKIYKSIKINIDSEYSATGSDAIGNISAYAYIGGFPYMLTNNVRTYFNSTSTDGIKIKILNNATGTDIKINGFTVKYWGNPSYFDGVTYAIDAYNNTYKEYFRTNDFSDSDNSTADWDTTTQELTF